MQVFNILDVKTLTRSKRGSSGEVIFELIIAAGGEKGRRKERGDCVDYSR